MSSSVGTSINPRETATNPPRITVPATTELQATSQATATFRPITAPPSASQPSPSQPQATSQATATFRPITAPPSASLPSSQPQATSQATAPSSESLPFEVATTFTDPFVITETPRMTSVSNRITNTARSQTPSASVPSASISATQVETSIGTSVGFVSIPTPSASIPISSVSASASASVSASASESLFTIPTTSLGTTLSPTTIPTVTSTNPVSSSPSSSLQTTIASTTIVTTSFLTSTQSILSTPSGSPTPAEGGTDDGINGRSGDISDQGANGSSISSKSLIGGLTAVLIIAFVAGAALVYYHRIKQKEKRRRFTAGPTAPQGYYADDEIDYIDYDRRA